MNAITFSFLGALAFAFLGASAYAKDDPEKSRTISPTDFEDCALRVLRNGGDADRVQATCEAELNAYVEAAQPASGTSGKINPPPGFAITGAESERIRLAAKYESCLLSTFEKNFKQSEAFTKCGPQLDAYLSTHDQRFQGALKQRILVAAEAALSKKALGRDG